MLQIGVTMFYYKLGQTLLRIGAASLLQIGAASLLQIGAAITSKGNRYCKIGQLLQIGATSITD